MEIGHAVSSHSAGELEFQTDGERRETRGWVDGGRERRRKEGRKEGRKEEGNGGRKGIFCHFSDSHEVTGSVVPRPGDRVLHVTPPTLPISALRTTSHKGICFRRDARNWSNSKTCITFI